MRAGGQVLAVVQHATLALTAVRAAESVLWAATGGASTLAALVASGGTVTRDGWIVAGIAALATGVTWWFEHRPRAARIAAELDLRMAFGGALTTAYECERGVVAPGAVARCLSERVGQRLNVRSARRAIAPASALSIAAPFLAVALFSVLAEQADQRRASNLSQLVNGLAGSLGSALEDARLDAAPGANPSELALAELRSSARRLGTKLASAAPSAAADELPGGARDEVRADLEQLERDLADLRRSVPEGELAGELDQARAWLDAARSAAAAEPGGSETASGATTEGGMGGDPGAPSTAPSSVEPSAPEAPGEGPNRIDGPDGAPAGSTDPASPEPTSGTPEQGLPIGPDWAPRYDRLVERWSERVRLGPAASEGARPAPEGPQRRR